MTFSWSEGFVVELSSLVEKSKSFFLDYLRFVGRLYGSYCVLWMSCYDCLSLDCDDTTSSCLAGDLANRFNWMCVPSRRITNVCSVCFSVNLPAFVPSENNTHTQNMLWKSVFHWSIIYFCTGQLSVYCPISGTDTNNPIGENPIVSQRLPE